MLDERTVVEAFRSPPERLLDVGDGAAVAVRTFGTGPDVVFVHGWPVSGATFRRIVPRLAASVRCHVVDLPGTGSSRWVDASPLSIDLHVRAVRRVVEDVDGEVAVVGHDSGGLIARHALAGDPRVRAFGLIDTEPSVEPGWRFRSFLAGSRLPGFGPALAWAAARPRVRRNPFVLGGAFADPSLLDGEFDEFFLRPLAQRSRRDAAMRIVRSFRSDLLAALAGLHSRMQVPVGLVWGAQDVFFPVATAEAMVQDFSDGTLTVVDGAGLFAHEERPDEVADALRAVVEA
jgi:pimeloyl-ACP methyl ester carboxylesterase